MPFKHCSLTDKILSNFLMDNHELYRLELSAIRLERDYKVFYEDIIYRILLKWPFIPVFIWDF